MTTVAVHTPAAPVPVRTPAAARPPAPAPAERTRAPSPAPTAQWSAGSVALAAPAAAAEDSWLMEQVRSAARGLPGYSLASAALGQDLLTGQAVNRTVGETLENLLSAAGPFGAGVGPVLGVLDVLGEAVQAVQRAFADHRVSFARIGRDLSAAWERVEVLRGLDANLAILAGYVEAFLSDVRAAIRQIVDVLLEAVRAAVVPLVEPLLADPAVAPVWSLATKVLGTDPLTGQPVEAPTVEILADFLTLIGQGEAVEQMRERGTLQQTADWLETQFERFQGLTGQASALFADAWDAISPQNLPRLLETLPALASRAVALFGVVADFATTVFGQVLVFVKDSLLGMVSDHAGQVPGFRLLTVILGRNPFTQAAVPRTAEGLIGGFIELLPGGRETYRQLAETGVIAEAAGRIESEMGRLQISWELITGTFGAIWDQMSLADLLDPVAAISRVIEQFGEPLGRILSFVATVVQVVIELVLRLMNFPSELLARIIAGVVAAVEDIKRDPVGFLMHLLDALKSGFQRFFDHILTHLFAGLAGWLFRGLRSLGIEPPTELSGAGVLETVLQVLGLTEDFLWERLAAAVGQERVDRIRGALDTMGQAWSFLQDVQERGLVAVWDLVAEQLSGLWETILSAAQDWLMTNLIQAAITKVLSMLDPTGVMAVINSAVAFFRAVQSVIDYITELLQIIKTYVDTLAAIARGEIEPGAAMLEQGLANAIPVALGFLAHQVGLGNVPEKIVEIIGRLRALVTRAIDWLIAQALRIGAAALRALARGGEDATAADGPPAAPPPDAADRIDIPVAIGGETHHLRNDASDGGLVLHSPVLVMDTVDRPDLETLVSRYNAATSRRARDQAAQDVGRWIAEHGTGEGPGTSAPGLGSLVRHGSQPIRLTDVGVPLWSMESEHVVPFMVVRKLWEALGVEGVASRSVLSSSDRGLTTILIYQGAADSKTRTEGARRARAANQMESMTRRYVAEGNSQGPADTPAADAVFRAEVIAVLRNEEGWYSDLTVACVQGEHQMLLGLSTHGQLRNEPSPVPTRDRIRQAAREEIDDADLMLDRALAETLRPAHGPDVTPAGPA
ncbi:phage tail protein [Microbacterium sp. A93]|uniref:phage tail protein n=1 Tax=Microbacterium sp. A93 TaxID=3450716 RepID=UPI003F42BE61